MILTVIGARPQFIKAAMVSKALLESGIQEMIIHTGQHYDENMSDIFWTELGLPNPARNLKIGSGLHGMQTGQMMIALEKEVIAQKPEALMVYGDTNSTLAGAIVASKLGFKVIHVEAGLRSFNRTMPEEINRILTDHVSDLLFCSSEEGKMQLQKEGITKGIHVVGDVMYDLQLNSMTVAVNTIDMNKIFPQTGDDYILATIHRPSNTDNDQNLKNILDAFAQLPFKIVWPLHPRLREKIKNYKIPKNLIMIAPASYLEMQALMQNCYKVCTDSGGLQKEAYWAQKPCITMREETEWVECMHDNWNMVVGSDTKKIIAAVHAKIQGDSWYPLYGDGNASRKIVGIIMTEIYHKHPQSYESLVPGN
jgi:UDP-GlcNAc3NAcA epimerase